ncbi:MAG: inorganic phosphate transporter [Crocinitomicaceae bacterium]|nr:inorganic phosphate transporter [Crocinitomicaceae bacterium]MBK8927241.1 inorganic phosphate transporter [Crocinitomicaceae bacterium]
MGILLTIIFLALVFDLINGFHDAANSIATVVSTKVLTPFQAVLWAAFFNVLAFWIFELKVADTVAKIVDPSSVTFAVVFAGLVAAISWNLLTWWFGIPSSSSHTLLGGFAGAAVANAGFGVVNQEKILITFAFIFAAPLVGMLVASIITIIIVNICRKANPSKADRWFKRLQLVSSALFSIGHGGNDAQKVMGIIAAAMLVYMAQLTAAGQPIPDWAFITQEVNDSGKLAITKLPYWIPTACYVAIGLGTMFGGWKIIKTMGSKITKVTPLEGVSAETAGAATLFLTEKMGIPVSTTHTITGSIIGVGMTKRISAVRWGVTISLLWAWILTIPVSGLIGATVFWLLQLFGMK